MKPQLCVAMNINDFKKRNLEKFVLERKFDGERAFLSFKDNEISIFNRKGFNVTTRYPELEKLWFDLPVVLDGEICVFDDDKTNFQKLLRRSQLSIPSRIKIMSEVLPVTFVAFDVLSIDGNDLRNEPLVERLKILESFVKQHAQPHLIISEYVSAEQLEVLWAKAETHEWEGLVAKKLDSCYAGGRRVSWVKLKRNKTITLKVVGLEEPNTAGVVALLEGGHRVQVSGERVSVGDSVVVSYLEKTESGRLRMPVKKEILRFQRNGKEWIG